MSEVEPSSYCVDSRCREEGPRHLHEPFGNQDALAVEVALRLELTPERVAQRIAQIARQDAELAILRVGGVWDISDLKRALQEAGKREASLRAERDALVKACQRYFDATSELVTEATFVNAEQEEEYSDSYNALYELVSPRRSLHPTHRGEAG